MIEVADIDRMVAIVRTGFVKNAGSGVARSLVSAGLTVRKGWSGPLPSDVRHRLRLALIQDHGVPEERFSSDGDSRIEARKRRDALENDRYEKKAEAVQSDRVMIKPVPGQEMMLSGRKVVLPDGCAIMAPVDLASELDVPGIILVENLEVFQDFHHLGFDIPEERLGDLVVFRGKPHICRQDSVEAFLRRIAKPVTAFVDIDPMGLSNAMSVPHFKDILWPGQARLERMRRLWRPDRYAAQAHVMPRLEAATGAVALARDFLKASGAGVMQEAFLDLRKRKN